MKTLLALLLLASPVFAQDQSAAALAASGCGPSETQFNVKTDSKNHPMGQPLPGKALIYVIEDQPGVCLLDCITTRVGIDGAWVGANHATSYSYFSIDPGDHRVCTQWQSSLKMYSDKGSAITMKAEPGKTYFVKVRITVHENQYWGIVLEPIDPAEGSFLISSAAYSTATQKKK